MQAIPAMLHPNGEASQAIELDIESNSTWLRPMIQLATDFERRRSEAGARQMLADRLVDASVHLGPIRKALNCNTAVFDLSNILPPQLTLVGADSKIRISLTPAISDHVVKQDGGCLWCGASTRQDCGACSVQHPNDQKAGAS